MFNILIIECLTEIRENLSEFLELEGYNVLTTDNAESGIKIALNKKPDIILCDILLPGKSAYRVLNAILANQETKYIPFIIISILSEKQNINEALLSGATAYLVKPFEPELLLDTIKKYLKPASLVEGEKNSDIY